MVSSTVGSSTTIGLEAALQSRILFDVLAVLDERRCADAVQLAAGEHRLQHVAGVHRALRRPGTHDRVKLIDEEQDPSLLGLHLLEHCLQALFELAAVLGARHERAHVQCEDGLVLEALGHVASYDPLREALDDRGLAHTRDRPRAPGCSWSCGRGSGSRGGSLSRGRSRGRACRCALRRRGRARTSPVPRRRTQAWHSSRAARPALR